MMNDSQALSIFAALAEPTRLRLLKHLVSVGPDGTAAGEIAETLEIAPSRLSHHLNALSEAGLVTRKRKARHIIYAPRFETLFGLQQFILEDCCRSGC